MVFKGERCPITGLWFWTPIAKCGCNAASAIFDGEDDFDFDNDYNFEEDDFEDYFIDMDNMDDYYEYETQHEYVNYTIYSFLFFLQFIFFYLSKNKCKKEPHLRYFLSLINYV